VTSATQEDQLGYPRERLRFTGHERDYLDSGDSEQALDYMHARTYSATLGRFLSVDPVIAPESSASPQLWNRYSYVAGNPTIFTDPQGLSLWTWIRDRIHRYRDQEADPFADCAECILYGVTPDVTVTAKASDATPRPDPPLDYRVADAIGGTDFVAGMLTRNPRYFATAGRKQVEIAFTLVVAGGGPEELTTDVSRWGRPGLEDGDWVMKGKSSFWNYLKSGKWDPGPWNEYAPPSSGQTFRVPTSALKSPVGFGVDGYIKALLGQRIYTTFF
jgi:RHS repeat-associated protein